MTTPTEELAKRHCAWWYEHTKLGKYEYNFESREELQAFREAVEADSDAERVKQEPMRYLYRYELLGGTALYSELRGSEEPLDVIPLYAQPFPSTEQLQQRVKELTDALHSVSTTLNKCADGHIAQHTALREIDAVVDKALANTQGENK